MRSAVDRVDIKCDISICEWFCLAWLLNAEAFKANFIYKMMNCYKHGKWNFIIKENQMNYVFLQEFYLALLSLWLIQKSLN